MVGRFCQPKLGHAVGDELDLMLLIGGSEERAARYSSPPISTYCLPCIRLPRTPSHYIFTLNMATAMFEKRWIMFNIQRDSSSKAEVVH
jgi:hypothetical protein